MTDVAGIYASNQQETQKSVQKYTPVVFTGNAKEYFGVWIVNLMLTIVTAGIYSAWAKVRRKKYFYNNTLIQNVGFDYHANPISILKGRVIAFIFFGAYSLFSKTSPAIALGLLAVLFLAMPWLVVRSAIFNARNTSHRGLRFDFVGKLKESIKAFLGMPLMSLVTMGMAIPWSTKVKGKFFVEGHKFGASQFKMDAPVNHFYLVYIKLLGVLMGLYLLIAIIAGIGFFVYAAKNAPKLPLPSFAAQTQPANAEPAINQAITLAAAEVETSSDTVAATETLKLDELITELSSKEGGITAEDEKTIEDAIAAMEKNSEDTPVSANEALADAETIANAEAEAEAYEMEEEATEPAPTDDKKDPVAEWLAEQMKENGIAYIVALITAATLLYLMFIFGLVGYLKARIGNLIWDNTSIDNLTFKSSLRARDFIWLYFTNTLAIMLSFGLATPWAQVRMAKYRAEKLQVIGDVDFDQFVGDKKAEAKATGEEIVDMFDVDLSFG